MEQPVNVYPRLLYYTKYNSNNITVQNSDNIWDGRFPVKTESYIGNSASDTIFEITYKSYSVDGSPSKIINQNKYQTQINYEPVHRVSSIILPGDFSADSSTYTFKYEYNNINNYIYVLSYRDTEDNDHSKIKYSIDGFGNVKQKDVFTSDTDSNSFKYNFNYMNILSDNTDALNNTTRFSNDGLGRNTQTNYPGGSATNNSYLYQNTLTNYFGGNYTGFIEFQKYTDEMNHNFEKYFDAVGNLLKEVKYAYEEPNNKASSVKMETDYYYDSLYRLIKVKTPENKYIFYSYDGYGRQSQRITPDAGQTDYVYDNNGNLIYSQDANQRNVNPDLLTFRKYDGINRLTGVGEAILRSDLMNDNNAIQYQSDSPMDYLTVNVYDTLSSSVVSDLFVPPSDYYTNVNNFTKGNLVATAYRTRNTDNWSYKYYRYDERGRVIKMWNIIDGLPVKEIRFQYNSQDQITQTDYGYNSEYKRYSYYYDYAGRLYTLNYANTDPTLDRTAIDFNFTTYSYNPNSLVSFQFYNSSQIQNQYEYNSRNWITSMNSLQGLFGFTNTYFTNGNVNTQLLFGSYKDNYIQNKYNLYYNFSYDYSNRLLDAINTNQGDLTFSVQNTYDKDGNLTTLKRYGDNNVVTDDFNYQYYSGTNKLRKVSGAEDQYSYDLNGNVTRDTINYNFNIQYDHRNLITQFYHTDRTSSSRPYTYGTRYYYDESGSRVRKLEYFNTQTNPPLITDWDNPGNGWTLYNNEFYVKSADGKDLATYQGSELEDWYVWGNDLAGKIRKDKPYYYFKDHLGSVRAIVNENAEIVAAFDYDAWGYPLEGRTFNSDSMKFKYTGKEMDKESLYDYFGARYYDGRIGRWGSVDPLMNKYLSNSPYNFTLNNPIIFLDKNGDDPYRDHLGSLNDVVNILNQNIGKSFWEVKNAFSTSTARYVYTQVEGFFDLQHFFASSYLSAFVGVSNTLEIGESIENFQDKGVWTFDENSGWDPEDPMSNLWGAIFGVSADNPLSLSQEDIQKFVELMLELGIVDKNDPSIAKDKLYIPQNDKDISLPQRKEYYYTPYRGESVNYPIPFRYLKMFGKEGRIP